MVAFGAIIVSRALGEFQVSGANTSINGNSAGQHGGVLSCGEADAQNGGIRAAVTITNGGQVGGNAAIAGDGGVIWASYVASLTVSGDDVSLTDNAAGRHGGVLHALSVDELVMSSGAAITRNQATQGSDNHANSSTGGVVSLQTPAAHALFLRVTALKAAANTAGRDGGVVYMTAADGSSCTLALSGSVLESNAAGSGAALRNLALTEQGIWDLLESWTGPDCALLALVDVSLMRAKLATPASAAEAVLKPAPQQPKHLWLFDPSAAALRVSCAGLITQTQKNGSQIASSSVLRSSGAALARSSLQECIVADVRQPQEQLEAEGSSQSNTVSAAAGAAAAISGEMLYLTPAAVRLSAVAIQIQSERSSPSSTSEASGSSLIYKDIWPLAPMSIDTAASSTTGGTNTTAHLALPTGSRLRFIAELVSAAGDVVEGYPPVALRLALEPAAWAQLQPSIVTVTDQATGQAEWSQVVVHGWPGDTYTLRQVWYGSLVPGADVMQQLQQARAALNFSANGSSSSMPSANSSSFASLGDICVLTASAGDAEISDDQLLYVNWQCAEGYAGRLCATCVPNLYLSNDFECQDCPPVGLNLFLGLLAFFANVVLMLYTSWTAYTDEGGAAAEEDIEVVESSGVSGPISRGEASPPAASQPPTPRVAKARRHVDSSKEAEVGSSEKLKVIIVHVQYFIIITRLNLNWPRIIHKLAASFGTVTGASNYVTFAPSCFFPDYTSSGQARVTVIYSLVAPCLAVLLCLALWALRYYWFNQSRLKRAHGGRYNGSQHSRSRGGVAALDLHHLSSLAADAPDSDRVLLVGVFILYPGLVQASLSIFACRTLDDGSGPYPEAQMAILVAIGAMNMTTNALKSHMLAVMEFLSLSVLVLTINLGLFFAMESTTGATAVTSEGAVETVVGILIILLNTCLVAGFAVLIAKSALPQARGLGLRLRSHLDKVAASGGRRWQPATMLHRVGCGKCSGGMLQESEDGYKTA
ncbi:hypothetical protein HXX76_012958 [Chlamydomonas incerta]|uniref:TRP C-terminal domain-containing protein n=1 Tax=Chlamydomonas incerta TaxID=51695 RepID=A0A835STU4_CHLIN|nr:hypothetical protein HXX76_012958 [Chlamydomonas incerta]|eukprot:KAG2426645.1 hypothetical protein HXX76_012958 [Chlamydomonas incerta]